MNNFKRLQEEDEARYDESQERRVKSGVMGTLSFLRFVGQLVDIYVPRVVDLFIASSGGNVGTNPHKHHHHPDPASSGPDGDRRAFAPGPDTEDGPVE